MAEHVEPGEQVAPTGPLAAGPGIRLLARIIDPLIIGIVGVLVGLAMGGFGNAWLVTQAVLVYGYFVGLDVAMGTTLGKKLFGLTVRGPDGAAPSTGQAAIREAFTLVGAVPFIGGFLALGAWIAIGVTINSNPENEGLHDRLAGGTRIVGSRA